MLREITVPHSEFLTIRIPKDYLEQEVEILVFPIKKSAVNNEEAEIQAFSSHSAAIIEDWKDENEDQIWI
ncbi:conserved hypothetical protein [Candidatus Methylobacter favarea]|uniref:Uncharacterized protein n=1 Tax=Candidatus Methylobacter favarea TaxID=2707345 RepID=A0A8S0WD39_9GAMM|nr:hypothetical protein [Candidatus Methylobacter favarea]CAA9892955.1 conserved hypothetical protein [Candidatus Methylobacter favarea]